MKRAAVIFLLVSSCCFGNPQQPEVVSGAASFVPNDTILDINTGSSKTILNWESFSIGQNEICNFNQPSNASIVLNRVTGNDPSSIFGQLFSNGKVLLINPNGVVIGKEGSINVSSFLASTFDILNHQFLEDANFDFSGQSNASIENFGTIKAIDGDIYLIAYKVNNTGSLIAKNGTVAAAAGREILLKKDADEHIFIKARLEDVKEETGIDHSGTIDAITAEIKADGNLYKLAIKNSGKIDALGKIEKNGKVYLVAKGGINETSGTIICKNSNDTGGEVRLLGKNVGLIGSAEVDVSAKFGGGTILVGGDFQGKNPLIFNAEAIFTAAAVHLKADALESGNGGKIILWADDYNTYFGSASAKGGALSGNGGLVEVSAKNLIFNGMSNTFAANGVGGTLLLDPTSIFILSDGEYATVANSYDSGSNTRTYYPSNTATYNQLLVATLEAQLAANNVTIQTLDNGTPLNPGRIYVSNSISWASEHKLKLDASAPDLGGVLISPGVSITATGSGTFEIICNYTITVLGHITANSINMYTDRGQILIGDTVTSNGRVVNNTGNMSLRANDIIITARENDSQVESLAGNITITGDTSTDLTLTSTATASAYIKAAGNIVINPIKNISLTGNAANPAYIEATGGTNHVYINTANGTSGTGYGILTMSGSSYITAPGSVVCYIAGASSLTGSSTAAQTCYISSTSSGDVTISNSSGVFTPGSFSITGGTATNSYCRLYAANGNVNLTTAGNISLSAGASGVSGNHAYIQTAAGNISVTGATTSALSLASTSYGTAYITAAGNVQINPVAALTITGAGSNAAYIAASGGTNHVYINTANGTSGTGYGGLTMSGSSYITAPGSVVCYLAGASSLTGSSTASQPCYITSTTTGNVTINNSSTLSLTAGTGTNSHAYISCSTGTISVSASSLTMTAKNSARAYISNTTGNINLTANGLSMTGSGDLRASYIETTTGSISLNSSNSAQGALIMTDFSYIQASGNINLYLSGSSSLTGSGGIVGIETKIASATGDITIVNNSGTFTIQGGDNSSNCPAYINSDTGNISLINAGNIYITADEYLANISQSTSGNLSVTSTTGTINLTSGSGSTAIASIETPSGNIAINANNSTNLTGGSNTSTYCRIYSGNGTISITGGANLLAGSLNTGNHAYIQTALGTISMSGLFGSLSLTSTAYGTSYIQSTSTISISAINALAMTGSGSNAAYIQNTTNSPISIISYNNMSLANNSYIRTTAGGSISLISISGGLTLNGTSGTAYIYPGSTSGSGTININCLGDLTITGGASNAYLQTRSGNISVDCANAYMNSSTGIASITANSDILIIADYDIKLDATSTITANTGNVTLVCDNKYPNSPYLGNGEIDFPSPSNVTAAGIVKLYTSHQNLNQLPSTINGAIYTPSPSGQDTNNERWYVYYPDLPSGVGPSFAIFYKNISNFIASHYFFDIALAPQELFYRIYNDMHDYICLNIFKTPSKKYIREDTRYKIIEKTEKIQKHLETLKEQERSYEESIWDKIKSVIDDFNDWILEKLN